MSKANTQSARSNKKLSSGAGCNNPGILRLMEDHDLLAHGELLDGGYTRRDRQRARILKYVVRKPEGVVRSKIVHNTIKGVDPETGDPPNDEREYNFEAVDGSDPDYQHVKRTTENLETAGFLRLRNSPAGIVVQPTAEAVDLISEGITETASLNNDLVHDRDFCEIILKSKRDAKKQLTQLQKDTLAESLRRYIDRINDYRLVFDVTMGGGFRDSASERMTKRYKTRFNDRGRVDKNFARLQSSLEYGYENAQNAVFATLTTDPKQFSSLYEAITEINENFHRLTQYLFSDPTTKRDTRRENVLGWSETRSTDVTGRPRERLNYVKVLEFTSAGYPHLHVLFFDVPERDKDGMPWLVDKPELIDKWGQGQIVDLYPLTYRDDLDQVGDFGDQILKDKHGQMVRDADGNPATKPVSEGFVCWYNYGDHGHDPEWINEKTRYHKNHGLIDMEGDQANTQQKTAGAYLGKYVSEIFNALQNPPNASEDFDHEGKAAYWKLAMYWATNRQFWSTSAEIQQAINLDGPKPDSDVEKAVRDCTLTSLMVHGHEEIDHHAIYGHPGADAVRSTLHREVIATLADIEFIGAFRYGDLPTRLLGATDIEAVENAHYDDQSDLAIAGDGDRPPPTTA